MMLASNKVKCAALALLCSAVQSSRGMWRKGGWKDPSFRRAVCAGLIKVGFEEEETKSASKMVKILDESYYYKHGGWLRFKNDFLEKIENEGERAMEYNDILEVIDQLALRHGVKARSLKAGTVRRKRKPQNIASISGAVMNKARVLEKETERITKKFEAERAPNVRKFSKMGSTGKVCKGWKAKGFDLETLEKILDCHVSNDWIIAKLARLPHKGGYKAEKILAQAKLWAKSRPASKSRSGSDRSSNSPSLMSVST